MSALSDRIAAEHQAGLYPVNGMDTDTRFFVGDEVESRCSCGDTNPVTEHLVAVTERAVRDAIYHQLEKVADRHSDEAARHRADSIAHITLRGARSHMATAHAYRNKAEATYDAARIARGETDDG